MTPISIQGITPVKPSEISTHQKNSKDHHQPSMVEKHRTTNEVNYDENSVSDDQKKNEEQLSMNEKYQPVYKYEQPPNRGVLENSDSSQNQLNIDIASKSMVKNPKKEKFAQKLDQQDSSITNKLEEAKKYFKDKSEEYRLVELNQQQSQSNSNSKGVSRSNFIDTVPIPHHLYTSGFTKNNSSNTLNQSMNSESNNSSQQVRDSPKFNNKNTIQGQPNNSDGFKDLDIDINQMTLNKQFSFANADKSTNNNNSSHHEVQSKNISGIIDQDAYNNKKKMKHVISYKRDGSSYTSYDNKVSHAQQQSSEYQNDLNNRLNNQLEVLRCLVDKQVKDKKANQKYLSEIKQKNIQKKTEMINEVKDLKKMVNNYWEQECQAQMSYIDTLFDENLDQVSKIITNVESTYDENLTLKMKLSDDFDHNLEDQCLINKNLLKKTDNQSSDFDYMSGKDNVLFSGQQSLLNKCDDLENRLKELRYRFLGMHKIGPIGSNNSVAISRPKEEFSYTSYDHHNRSGINSKSPNRADRVTPVAPLQQQNTSSISTDRKNRTLLEKKPSKPRTDYDNFDININTNFTGFSAEDNYLNNNKKNPNLITLDEFKLDISKKVPNEQKFISQTIQNSKVLASQWVDHNKQKLSKLNLSEYTNQFVQEKKKQDGFIREKRQDGFIRKNSKPIKTKLLQLHRQ